MNINPKKINAIAGPWVDYPDDQFLYDIIAAAKDLDYHSQYVVRRQLGIDQKQIEFFF